MIKRILAAAALFLAFAGAAQAQSFSTAPYVPPVIDASTMAGADICAQVSNAWAALAALGRGGGIVDARRIHGTQNVAGSCFVNYPAPGANNPNFTGVLETQDVAIVTPVTQIAPGGLEWRGNSPYGLSNPPYTNQGTVIQPSNTFATTSPLSNPSYLEVVEAVAAGGSGYAVNDTITLTGAGGTCSVWPVLKVTAVSGGVVTAASIQTRGSCTVLPTGAGAAAVTLTQSASSGGGTGATFTSVFGLPLIQYSTAAQAASAYGIRFKDMRVSCLPPNGTYISGSIGIQNWYAEEDSGGDNVNADSCFRAYDIEGNAARDGGYWTRMEAHGYGVTDVNALCLEVGTTDGGSSFNKGFHGFTCTNVNTGGVQSNFGIALDSVGFSLDNVHCEQAAQACLLIGANHAASVNIANFSCSSTVGNPMVDCVRISGATNSVVHLANTSLASTHVTNLINDQGTGGGVLPATSFTVGPVAEALYYRGGATTQKVFDSSGILASPPSAIVSFWCSGTVTSSQTSIMAPFNGSSAVNCTSTSANLPWVAPAAGTFRNLQAKALTGGVNASSGVLTLRFNGSDTVITCTFGTGTTCADTTHSVTVTAGQTGYFKMTSQATETLANVSGTIEFQPPQ